MTKSDHDITLDEKHQEQPKTKDRAVDPSSKNQPKPRADEEAGKYSEQQRHQNPSSEKE
jgi:hypothetical protein